MAGIPEVTVTLSATLLRHLRGLAADLEVPIEWLVAGLVCDTLESLDEGQATRSGLELGARPCRGIRRQ